MGHPRTGTESLFVALSILGYHPAHIGIGNLAQDQYFTLANDTYRDQWYAWAKGESNFEPILEGLFDHGIDSTTGDWPFSSAYKELIGRFPHASVIMSVHPRGAKAWTQSIEHTFGSQTEYAYYVGYMSLFSDCFKAIQAEKYRNTSLAEKYRNSSPWVNDKHYRFSSGVHDVCEAAYEKENQEMRKNVPPERLLIYNASQGWGPLCDFLRLPQPSLEFPYIDHTDSNFWD